MRRSILRGQDATFGLEANRLEGPDWLLHEVTHRSDPIAVPHR